MMTRRISLLGLALAVAVVCIGCRVEGFSLAVSDHHRHGPDEHLYIAAGHVCTHDCASHYWNGDKLIVLRGHHHHDGCGHYWNGTHWVLARSRVRSHRVAPVVVEVEHRHGPGCGHVYDRRHHRWISVSRHHRHYPGCGHVYIDGRWSLRIR